MELATTTLHISGANYNILALGWLDIPLPEKNLPIEANNMESQQWCYTWYAPRALLCPQVQLPSVYLVYALKVYCENL